MADLRYFVCSDQQKEEPEAVQTLDIELRTVLPAFPPNPRHSPAPPFSHMMTNTTPVAV